VHFQSSPMATIKHECDFSFYPFLKQNPSQYNCLSFPCSMFIIEALVFFCFFFFGIRKAELHCIKKRKSTSTNPGPWASGHHPGEGHD
jgi:hypothetical protein